MKKYVLFSTALACTALSPIVFAEDGKVNFKGTILESACTVESSSQNLDVNLGRVSKTVFTAAGDTSSPMPFSLKLENCPTDVLTSGVAVRFEGTTVSGKTDILDITGGAAGVGVQIKDKAGQKIVLGSESTTYTPLVAGDNTLDFTAYYVSTSTTVTAGAANAVANFTIIYP
ncbi:type 1 fimbrial protein [Budviciaceae bacterium CWB-B4]|uniref:Type 1 fimbrial protein n=1 Tax=Limnobaculum xujianqingii TaxID=2738837 RepID=A0A9D7AJR6_9GAMM|nr:fimbrial protein [Limnobaculum xujianqingii]MBK5073872.1 type 1 fimbrial protein [Limnobaculum xujianqingii]MBK5177234.1 type 1 fimbrial protein [Limnobaculum xujianqingii]